MDLAESIFLAAALHAGFLLASAWTIPALGETDSEIDRDTQYVFMLYPIPPAERTGPPEEELPEPTPGDGGPDHRARNESRCTGLLGGSMGEPAAADAGHHSRSGRRSRSLVKIEHQTSARRAAAGAEAPTRLEAMWCSARRIWTWTANRPQAGPPAPSSAGTIFAPRIERTLAVTIRWVAAQQGKVAAQQANDAAQQGTVAAQQGKVAAQQGNDAAQQGNDAAQQGNDAAQQGKVAGEPGNEAGELGNEAGRLGNEAGALGKGAAALGRGAAQFGKEAGEPGKGAAQLGNEPTPP